MDIFEYEEDGTKIVGIFCNRVNSNCTIEEIVELVEAIIEETPPFLDSDIVFKGDNILIQINDSIDMRKLLNAIREKID